MSQWTQTVMIEAQMMPPYSLLSGLSSHVNVLTIVFGCIPYFSYLAPPLLFVLFSCFLLLLEFSLCPPATIFQPCWSVMHVRFPD